MLNLPLTHDYTGKVVVVTGAGGVLCGDMARAYAQAGAKVAALDLNEAAVLKLAEEVTLIGMRQIFYARLPEVKGTAGTAAFILDEVTRISDAYTWTMDHTVEVDDPLELFPITMIEIGE